jgi:hypothetical protein
MWVATIDSLANDIPKLSANTLNQNVVSRRLLPKNPPMTSGTCNILAFRLIPLYPLNKQLNLGALVCLCKAFYLHPCTPQMLTRAALFLDIVGWPQLTFVAIIECQAPGSFSPSIPDYCATVIHGSSCVPTPTSQASFLIEIDPVTGSTSLPATIARSFIINWALETKDPIINNINNINICLHKAPAGFGVKEYCL